MGKYTLFKELHSYFKELTKEEELVLCIHCLLLEAGLDNVCKTTCISDVPINEKQVLLSEKYIQYGTPDSLDNFCIGKILINSNWRKNSSCYNFTYKNKKDDSNYNLNILNVDKSIIVQLVNTANAASLHSFHIELNEYIETDQNASINWTKINVPKLENTLNKSLLDKFGLNINKDSYENKVQIESTHCINENFKPCSKESIEKGNEPLQPEHARSNKVIGIPVYDENTHFNDKLPVPLNNISNIFDGFRKPNATNPDALTPDGLLFGPKHHFFNPQNLRYDPMGPFGVEPNFD